MWEEAPLIDTGDYPKIDAICVGDHYLLPDGRVRFLMCDLTRINGIWQRYVCGSVTRPLATLLQDQAAFWARQKDASAARLLNFH